MKKFNYFTDQNDPIIKRYVAAVEKGQFKELDCSVAGYISRAISILEAGENKPLLENYTMHDLLEVAKMVQLEQFSHRVTLKK